ncbi:hypothetical protein K461DRAFT_81825 [Myriangium duriaei CBS 260.36]|uniref:Uncharacterized protein n=1 Tax=Myriangium duriaei CBS 260.36 TaxID=1168546 RepID=A0A9P4MQQ0_9PEZI|nr:hypothetical protein K461DRAFT_81825 [Myriangium duriaei CBS 260.36]
MTASRRCKRQTLITITFGPSSEPLARAVTRQTNCCPRLLLLTFPTHVHLASSSFPSTSEPLRFFTPSLALQIFQLLFYILSPEAWPRPQSNSVFLPPHSAVSVRQLIQNPTPLP